MFLGLWGGDKKLIGVSFFPQIQKSNGKKVEYLGEKEGQLKQRKCLNVRARQ